MAHFKVSGINIVMKNKNMYTITAIIFNFLFILGGFTCNAGTSGDIKNDPLPDARPQKLTIGLSMGGGMLYYGENLYISEDSCTYEVNDGGAKTKVKFKMTPAELDNLYKVFTDNNFDRIKIKEEMVYDRGGESISINWAGGKHAGISDAGMSFVKESWQKEWSACLKALSDIEVSQSNKQKKDYEVRIDKSFFGKKFSLGLKNQPIMPNETVLKSDDEYISKNIQLLPGTNRLSVSWDSKNYETINVTPDSSKGVNLTLEDNKLSYKLIK